MDEASFNNLSQNSPADSKKTRIRLVSIVASHVRIRTMYIPNTASPPDLAHSSVWDTEEDREDLIKKFRISETVAKLS